jgi:hypothetical protein
MLQQYGVFYVSNAERPGSVGFYGVYWMTDVGKNDGWVAASRRYKYKTEAAAYRALGRILAACADSDARPSGQVVIHTGDHPRGKYDRV